MPKHTFKKSDKIAIAGVDVNLEGLEIDVDTGHMYETDEIVKHFSIMSKALEGSGRKDMGVMYTDRLIEGFDTEGTDPNLFIPTEVPVVGSPSSIPTDIANPIAYKVGLITGDQNTEYPYTLMIPMLTRGSSHYELLAIEILDNQKNCNAFVVDSSKAPKEHGNNFLENIIAPMLAQAGLKVDLENSAFCQPSTQSHTDSVYGSVACGAYMVNNAENIINFGLDSVIFSQEVNSTPEVVMARDTELRSKQFVQLISQEKDISRAIHGVRNSEEFLQKLEDRFHRAIEEITPPLEPYDAREVRDEVISLTRNVIEKTRKYFPDFNEKQMSDIFNFSCQMMTNYGDPFEKATEWKAAIADRGIVEPLAGKYLKMAQTFQIQLANEALDNNIFSNDGGWFKMTDLKPKESEIITHSTAAEESPSDSVEYPTAYPVQVSMERSR